MRCDAQDASDFLFHSVPGVNTVMCNTLLTAALRERDVATADACLSHMDRLGLERSVITWVGVFRLEVGPRSCCLPQQLWWP
jgi:pentatricopeptide repeat protein